MMIQEIKRRLSNIKLNILSHLSDDENIGKLKALKNCYDGRRIFIVGNGPSLNDTNIQLLKDEITIGCNGLFLLFDQMGFLPTYYTVEDVLVAEDRADIINKLRGTTKIFPRDLKYCLKPDEDTIYLNFARPGYGGFPRFSGDIRRQIYWGGTVTFLNMQLAYYLGSREVYLIGVDHNYLPPSIKDAQEGNTITARTPDKNHFHPDYFGPGFRYHDPMVDRMEIAYNKAKTFFEENDGCIYNASVGGKLEIFERVDFQSLF